MPLQAMVKQHGGGRNQQAALGGDAVAAACASLIPGAGLVGGQVKGFGEIAAVIGAELSHRLIQRVGKFLRRLVRAAQGIGRLLHRPRQHRNVAGGPLFRRVSRLEPQGPGQFGLADAVLGDALGVAQGENGDGQPLPQPGVGVPDGLGLAVKARFRLQHDAQPVHVGHDVHAPAARSLLVIGVYPVFTQEQGQGAILEIFLLSGHGGMRPSTLPE